jgi:hypothetical protein
MYRYEDFRERVVSTEGQRVFVNFLQEVKRVTDTAGCITAEKAAALVQRCGGPGDSWAQMAFVDHLVATGAYVRAVGQSTSWQGAVLFPVRG